MRTGRFIVLEGGEGVGKSTQASLLSSALKAQNISVVLTREPGGTPGAEAIRSLLLNPPSNDISGWNPRAEALLFAAARSDHVDKLIRPALAAGRWVICDRFIDSSRAYQGGGSGLTDENIMTLHAIGSDSLLPDITLLLEAGENATQARLSRRDPDGSDAIGGRDLAYHTRVAEAFSRFVDAEPSRFQRIDGEGSPDDVHERIMAALEPLLEGKE